jgi:hypothetical protein
MAARKQTERERERERRGQYHNLLFKDIPPMTQLRSTEPYFLKVPIPQEHYRLAAQPLTDNL